MSNKVKSLKKAEQVIFDNLTTKSGWIRFLTDQGFTRGQTVAYLNTTVLKDKKQIRYQHVRNVLITPLSK